MSAPIPASVYVDQNTSFDLVVTWKDSTGSPVNLTGYTASFSIAPNYNKTPALTLTTGSGITLGGVAGTITIHATATQTNTLGEGSFVAELVAVDAGGNKTSLLKGPIASKGKVVA